ncbi:MAG TPA: SAM-dependent methyltransferase [Pyrinomonadaceae bacterium]|jgi:methyltransferase (TIGR00027 family)
MRDNTPSATAYLIAQSTHALSLDPLLGGLIPGRAAELSRRFVEARARRLKWLDDALNHGWLRPLSAALERATIPGIKLHYALRKRYLEEVARAALAGGIRQQVVIGAGFDTLALRLHEDFPAARFFEIDHSATQAAKRRVLDADGQAARNMHFVALDVARESLQERLLGHTDYRADDDTLFVVEGLLMYLSPAHVDAILRFVRRHSGRESVLAFTFMETQADGRIGFRGSSKAVDLWLRLHGESFKWGMRRDSIGGYLAERGFTLRVLVTAETLRGRYLDTERLKRLRLAEGECICVASSA